MRAPSSATYQACAGLMAAVVAVQYQPLNLADYEAKVTALITQAKAQNLVRPDLDELGAAIMFTSIIQDLVIRVSIIEARKSLVAEGKLVFPIFLHGIGSTRVCGAKRD